jgi:hypothetical protein
VINRPKAKTDRIVFAPFSLPTERLADELTAGRKRLYDEPIPLPHGPPRIPAGRWATAPALDTATPRIVARAEVVEEDNSLTHDCDDCG